MTDTVVAFDLGLANTGACWTIPDGYDSDHFACPPKLRGGQRLTWWRNTFTVLLMPLFDRIVVEGPFMHPSHPTGAMALIELHGVFRLTARDAGLEVTTVPPSSLKKWATGKGNADKEAMVAAAVDLGWFGTDHNEADAFALWFMATEGAV